MDCYPLSVLIALFPKVASRTTLVATTLKWTAITPNEKQYPAKAAKTWLRYHLGLFYIFCRRLLIRLAQLSRLFVQTVPAISDTLKTFQFQQFYSESHTSNQINCASPRMLYILKFRSVQTFSGPNWSSGAPRNCGTSVLEQSQQLELVRCCPLHKTRSPYVTLH